MTEPLAVAPEYPRLAGVETASEHIRNAQMVAAGLEELLRAKGLVALAGDVAAIRARLERARAEIAAPEGAGTAQGFPPDAVVERAVNAALDVIVPLSPHTAGAREASRATTREMVIAAFMAEHGVA